MTDSKHVEWGTSPFTIHRPARTQAIVEKNLDRLWVTWMVDRAFAPLRRELGMPSRFQERASARRAAR